MSADKDTLEKLLEQVRAAKGADRELDALLEAMRDGRAVRENIHPTFGRQLLARNSRPPHDEYWLDHPTKANPSYTASVDAALALTERVLPGWTVAQIGQQDDKSWWCELREGYLTSYSRVARSETSIGKRPANLPLAILAALLSALIAQPQPTGMDQ